MICFLLLVLPPLLLQTSPEPSPSPSTTAQQVQLVLSPELGSFIVEFMKCALFHWVMLTIGRFF